MRASLVALAGKHHMHCFLSPALTAAALATFAAAAPVAAQTPPTFAVESELVTIDAVVLTRDGAPVRGLTREDFVVREDGVVQELAAFEVVEAQMQAWQPGVPAPLPPFAATNVTAPPTRRTFAFVLDDVHVGALDLENAKAALRDFIGREARPGDRILLATTSDARFWTTTRAPADAAFLGALQSITSHERRADPTRVFAMTYYEAMRIEEANDAEALALVRTRGYCRPSGGGGESPAGPGARPEPVRHCFEAAQILTLERSRLQQALGVVRGVLRSLGTSRGPKSLVLISAGFPVDPGVTVFRELRELAARANVVLSYVDARGVAVGPPVFTAEAGVALGGRELALAEAFWRQNEAGPVALAEETGGLVLRTNDLPQALSRIAAEAHVTYMLGYVPPDTRRKGRYRRVSVQVRTPGLRVRARPGYFPVRKDASGEARLSPVERALRQPFDSDDVPLRLAAYVMGAAPIDWPTRETGAEVLFAGELRLEALAVRGGGRESRTSAPALRLLTTSPGGEAHDSAWSLTLALKDEPPNGPEAWLPFLTRLVMLPGEHRARLAVESGGRIGTVTVHVSVPPLDQPRLTAPILSDRLASSGSERDVVPVARRAFDRGRSLHAWVALLQASVDPLSGRPQATIRFRAQSPDGQDWASGAGQMEQAVDGGIASTLSVPLAQGPPGDNELVLTVTDGVSGRTFEVREPFAIEPAGREGP